MHTLKKLFGLLLLAVSTQSYAQEMLVLNGKQYRVADIENITVTMTKPLLPDVLATHAEYSIFSKALELTGLADTLAYWNTFKTLEETGVSGRPGGGMERSLLCAGRVQD